MLTPIAETRSAILWAGFPGPHGGGAVADALFGRRSPTGRLPFTAPRSSGVVPVHHNDRPDASSVYRDQPDPVLFPFGAGMGHFDAIVNSLTVLPAGDGAAITVTARNPHAVSVAVVMPVFVRRWGGAVLPRRQELAGVLRAHLPSGDKRMLRLALPANAVRAFGAPEPWLRVSVAGLTEDVHLPRREGVADGTR